MESCDVRPELKIIGRSNYLQFAFNRMHCVPDGVLNVENIRIISNYNTEESIVCCDFTFKGTNLFDVPFVAVVPEVCEAIDKVGVSKQSHKVKRKVETRKASRLPLSKRVKLITTNNDISHNTGTVVSQTSQIGSYDTQIIEKIGCSQILSEPFKLSVSGQIIMHLDVNKYIHTMHFDGKHY